MGSIQAAVRLFAIHCIFCILYMHLGIDPTGETEVAEMKKASKIYIAAGLCLLVFLINELGMMIGSLHMYDMQVADAELSAQALEAAHRSFAPMLISSVVRVLIYLLLVLYCFRLNGSKMGAWLFALSFLLEAARCGRMFVDSINYGFMNMNTVCFALMLVFCLAMVLLKRLKSNIIWGFGGVVLGLYLLLTIADKILVSLALIRSQAPSMMPWWIQVSDWGVVLCRAAGFILLWRQEGKNLRVPMAE